MSDETQAQEPEFIDLVADIVSAYVSRNNVPIAELPNLIASVHASLSGLGQPAATPAEDHKVTSAQVRKSVTPDAITSFIDGKSYKSLKRHLTSNGLTPDEYRQKYGLPRDYPMVAANYAAQRSELAKSLGLGQLRRDRAAAKKAAEKRTTPDPIVTAPLDAKPARRGRPKKAEANAAE
ncbi:MULTISPECIES: MucR family transcriptional regulator [Methylobacterium]|uniref:MucR family transcriptional regulator n=2 Tax=Methylobacterium TaxID=407 RepID=A0A2R4WM70_9HYPH|nr:MULTISPECIES: MucR family transcriptional regulator [Methylobacterium]MBZ6414506.1 MucR family transcriptional regulator [Methylobacterium sp.]AWB22634.1 MucR family transcriptional regulator [Methylobacterium currus]MBK3401047.1 MucR family transcriptional regulator [Methylobacterium ajmalii]MBK3411251.1 MucR family transcriptional regulator [Methylobacterium ajmalii]MBK3424809.1 MucR family transcriptional regulator [Methylobacterium ajmalii]